MHRFSRGLLPSVALAISISLAAQVPSPVLPQPGPDGVYQVSASALTKLSNSPKVEFPRELAAYELADKVVVSLAISPEGKVTKTKVLASKYGALKQAVEKTVSQWEFQPYLLNGAAVPVRTEITFNFDNTFDHYRDTDGDAPVEVSVDASHTLLTRQVPPHYPPQARADRIQGQVQLRVIVGKDGRVHGLHIISGHPKLVAAAYEAVRQWEFKPYVKDGKTVPFDTRITINFTLAG